MPSRSKSEYYAARMYSSANPVGFCVSTLLAWVSAIDGKITEEETELLQELRQGGGLNAEEYLQVIEHALRGDVHELQLACELVQAFEIEQKVLLMEMAIGMALADGRLGNAEAHLLLFFSDLLSISLGQLNEIFREVTSHEFPNPGDLSSIAWWEERERKTSENGSGSTASGGKNGSQSRSGNGRQRGEYAGSPLDEEIVWAFSVLGVECGEDESAVRKAFRRLSHVHHPDRFYSLGEEAVRAATVTYKRILKAYEVLGQP